MKRGVHRIKRFIERRSFFRRSNKPLVDQYDGILYKIEDHVTNAIFIQLDHQGNEVITEDFFTSRNIKRILSLIAQ